MPEGPEVRLSAELIRPLVVGKTAAVFSMYGRYQQSNPDGFDCFSNKPIALDVKTKGKFMYWILDDTTSVPLYMFCTFGMTGQFSPKKGKHPALGIEFTDGSQVYFNDPRHFGTIRFVKGEANLNKKLAELGWDPLSSHSDLDLLCVESKLKFSTKSIGELLMNQSIFAGVGNYIRAEALYRSKISPWRIASKLTADEVYSLCDDIVDVMEESYQHQGATIHTYTTVFGEEGKYSSCFKVYGQKNDPLGNPIIKEKTPEGRMIHWCPMIQK